MDRYKTYTTSYKRKKDYVPINRVESYMLREFRNGVDTLIEAFNLYDKFDEIKFDFTKDERRK